MGQKREAAALRFDLQIYSFARDKQNFAPANVRQIAFLTQGKPKLPRHCYRSREDERCITICESDA